MAFLRSLGAAATSSAEATLALARDANPLSWESEAAYAEWALSGERLIEQIPRALDVLFRLHVPFAGDRILRYGEAPGEFTQFTVGFVDLVDSTSVVERWGSQEVVRAMADFARLALTAAVSSGARLVKLIGDEAMFVAGSAEQAASIARSLVLAAHDDARLPDVRIGLGAGEVLVRDGDVFGPTVNRAARIVNIAEPSTVLVDGEVAAHLPDDAVVARGARILPGFDEPVLVFELRQ